MLSENQLKIINTLLFLGIIFLQILDNYLRDIKEQLISFNIIKNVTMLFICIFYMLQIFKKSGKGVITVFNCELKNITYLGIILSFISLYFSAKQDQFTIQTVDGVARIIFPCIVAYLILNVMDFEAIYISMVFYLLFGFGMYIYSKGIDNINLVNISNISFWKSTSYFESHFFSIVAISCYLFFLYYQKNKFYFILSIIFVLMTFKRPMILFVVFSLILLPFIKSKRQIPRGWIWALKIGTVVGTLIYITILNGWLEDVIYSISGMPIVEFTRGRSWFFQTLIGSGYESFGLQSSVVYLRDIEMDLVKIYIELSIVGLIVFVNYFANFGASVFYNYLVSTFILLLMLTGHFYDITYFWIIMYVVIGCVLYKSESVENKKYISKRISKIKIKW